MVNTSIINNITDNDNLKVRVKILNKNFFKHSEKKYFDVLVSTLIDYTLKYNLKIEHIFYPNKCGTGIIFSAIKNEKDFQDTAKRIIFIYEKQSIKGVLKDD